MSRVRKRNARTKTRQGFTLIELLVVVVVIGILAAVALPNFVGAQTKAKVAQVKGNMHSVQLAAEEYATDRGGQYGATATDILPYFPGGGQSAGSWVGTPPPNPINPGAPSLGGDTSILNIQAARLDPPGTITNATPGYIIYDSALAPTSYGVVGFDDAGKSVAGNSGKQLVLSNQ